MEALLAAKTKLVTDYLVLAQQMNHTANSMTNYVSTLAALPSHSETIQHLVPVPQLPPAEPFADYLNELKGLKPASNAAADRKSRNNSNAAEDGAVAVGGGSKKRGRKSTGGGNKKEKDPNAPKRPASAYIIFQNELRPKLRETYPDLPYKDLLTKISEEWKAVPEDKKNAYNDNAKALMDEWRKDNAAYQAGKGEGVSPAQTPAAADDDDEEEDDAPPPKKARQQSEDSSSGDDPSQSSSSDEDEPPRAAATPARAVPSKPSSSNKKSAAVAPPSTAKKSKKQK